MNKVISIAVVLVLINLALKAQTFKSDTVQVMMLVGDTSRLYRNNRDWEKDQRVWWEYGYIVKEYHNTLENMKPKLNPVDIGLYGTHYEVVTGTYIDNELVEDKGWVIFSIVIIK